MTGIDKYPVPSIEVFAPGPNYGDGPGVVDDLVGDRDHHGGANKAVYAMSRAEVDYWEGQIGRPLRDGQMGENLTVDGLDLESLLIGQQLRFAGASGGDARPVPLLEVSVPRSPCRTFAIHMGVPGWTRLFLEHGRCGVYFRVVEAGVILAGDEIVLLDPPDHDITMLVAFAAASGDDDAAARVVAAGCMPAMYHDRLVKRLAGPPAE